MSQRCTSSSSYICACSDDLGASRSPDEADDGDHVSDSYINRRDLPSSSDSETDASSATSQEEGDEADDGGASAALDHTADVSSALTSSDTSKLSDLKLLEVT